MPDPSSPGSSDLLSSLRERLTSADMEETASCVRSGIRLAAFSILCYEVANAAMLAVSLKVTNEDTAQGYSLFENGVNLSGSSLQLKLAVSASVGIIALLAVGRGFWEVPLILAGAWVLLAAFILNVSSSSWPWQPIDDIGFGSRIAEMAIALVPGVLLVFARPREGEPSGHRSPYWALAAPAFGIVIGWGWGSNGVLLERVAIAVIVAMAVLGWRDLRLAIASATLIGYVGFSRVLEYASLPGQTMSGAEIATIGIMCGTIAAIPAAIGFRGRRFYT